MQTRIPRCDQNYAQLDIVLWFAEDKKIIIIIELIVSWEEDCDEAHEQKSSKYWELKEACQDRG